MRRWWLMLAALTAAAPGQAQERPLVLPSQDVAVVYRSRDMVPGPAGETASTVTVRFAADRRALRIDGPFGQFYALVEIDAPSMTIVMPELRIYAEQPADTIILTLLRDTALRRIGVDTVAGLACTAYDAAVNDRSGRVCLTDDGVLLRAQISEPNRHPELQAVSVSYGRQPARMFEIPAGFHRLEIGNLPYGSSLHLPGGGLPGGRFGK